MMKMQYLSLFCAVMMACTLVWATSESVDLAPGTAPCSGPGSDDQWDLIWYLDVDTTCLDFQILGAAYAGAKFFVTGGNNGLQPNYLYIITQEGVLDTAIVQPTTSPWGLRDLTYDGTYLYAGDDNAIIYAYDLNGNLVPSMNMPKPAGVTVVRALAYDPATDHFWTANFGSNLYEFDRAGNVIWSGPVSPLTGIYGLTWDTYAPGGPFLWMYDQGTAGQPLRCIYHQFNPTTHAYTGVTYTVPLLPESDSQVAGGCEITDEWSGGGYSGTAMVAIAQATPSDVLYLLEMYGAQPPTAGITMTPYNPPILIPATGGSFSYNIGVSNTGTTSQNVDIWCMVRLPNGAMYGPVLGPVNVTMPANWSTSRDRNQAVPAGAPAGSYMYFGYIGDYPGVVYDVDSFPFTKAGSDGMTPEGWKNFGGSF